MKDVCYFTLKRPDLDKKEMEAWCLTHLRWAEACSADPIDATLAHLEREAQPRAKTCPHCGKPLNA